MSDINWKENAIATAFGCQFIIVDGNVYDEHGREFCDGWESGLVDAPYFQINEITTGDFIPASELDTEQKYNEVVKVFGLFGFKFGDGAEYMFSDVELYGNLTICHDGIYATELTKKWCKRQLTYHQIIAIGKLKRMMLEREKSAPKTTPDLTPEKHKSAVDYLTECVEVQKQRGEQYDSTGTGERSFDAAAKAYNAMTGGNIKGSDVCLILTCVKAVRQYSNPERIHEDSLLDLVSYASLWAEELNKELK